MKNLRMKKESKITFKGFEGSINRSQDKKWWFGDANINGVCVSYYGNTLTEIERNFKESVKRILN